MKRFLSILLAVVMVSLAIPFTVSAATVQYEVPGKLESRTINGVLDTAFYSGEPVAISQNGVEATAYFAYDAYSLYVFVDVTDSTRMENYYSQNKDADGDGKLDTMPNPGQSQMETNDCVVIGFNASGNDWAMRVDTNNDPATDGSVSPKTAVVGGYRLVSGTGAALCIANVVPACGGGFTSVDYKTVETANGYTAEFKLTFKDGGITKADLEGDDFGIMIQVNDRTDVPVNTDKDTNVNRAFLNSEYTGAKYLYIWRTTTLSPIKDGGFDSLKGSGIREPEPASYLIHQRPGNDFTIDGVKDDLYSTTPSLVVDKFYAEGAPTTTATKADVYMAYTDAGMYFFVDVTDDTKQSDFINHNGSAGNAAAIASPGYSQFIVNDCVVVAFNADTVAHGSLPATGNKAGGVIAYRSINSDPYSAVTTGGTVGATRSAVVVDKENNEGYYAEIFIPFTDDLTVGDLQDGNIGFQIEVVNAGDIAVGADFVNAKKEVVYGYSNPNYIYGHWAVKFTSSFNGGIFAWQQKTLLPVGVNGFDGLTANCIDQITVDPSLVPDRDYKATFEVGELFTKEGVRIGATFTETDDFLSFGSFDVESDIYLSRAFTEPGVHTINIIVSGTVVASYDITVVGGSANTGDSAAVIVPFAGAIAVLALAGIVLLVNRKKSRA
jgi:LPXTG-motif cell wall-anchored protein